MIDFLTEKAVVVVVALISVLAGIVIAYVGSIVFLKIRERSREDSPMSMSGLMNR